jgi:hypothetical protein
MKTLHIEEYGAPFQYRILDQDGAVVNISAATEKKIYFIRPDGTTFVRTAVLVTDGTDGLMKYVLIVGDLDVSGDWKVQAYLKFADGQYWTGYDTFRVDNHAVI